MTFFVSPLAGILIDSIGLRRTAVLGGAIATVGMLASSFALAHVSAFKQIDLTVDNIISFTMSFKSFYASTGRSFVPYLWGALRRWNIFGLQSFTSDPGPLFPQTFGFSQRFGDSWQFGFHIHLAVLP
jgi:hypothetical protein